MKDNNKKPYLVTAEFCCSVDINPEDLRNENYDDVVAQFTDGILEKLRNGEVLDNIISIKPDKC